MYEDLVNLARYCAEKDACINCPVGGCQGTTGIMNHLADAIEELQQTVKHYKGCSDDWYKEACDYKAMLPRWIPVTERLPNIGTYIVAGKMKYSFEENYEHFVDVASYGFWDDKKEESWLTFNDWYEGQQEYEITHYMPLPEPPKEET